MSLSSSCQLVLNPILPHLPAKGMPAGRFARLMEQVVADGAGQVFREVILHFCCWHSSAFIAPAALGRHWACVGQGCMAEALGRGAGAGAAAKPPGSRGRACRALVGFLAGPWMLSG